MIGLDLLGREFMAIPPVGFVLIPFSRGGDRLLEVPYRLPLEQVECLVDGQIQLGGLVNGVRIGGVDPFAAGVFQQLFDEFGDGAVAGEGRAKVESGRERV